MTNFNSRDEALDLVENGIVSAEAMLTMALKYMSTDDVADMLDCNELSDRFMEDDEDDGQPDWAQEWSDFDPECQEVWTLLEIIGFIAVAYLIFKFAPQVLEAAFKASVIMIGLFFFFIVIGLAWGQWTVYFNQGLTIGSNDVNV